VYQICLALDKILFNISDSKKELYRKNMADYNNLLLDSKEYEKRNDISSAGDEK
jgi:hypothetical protein